MSVQRFRDLETWAKCSRSFFSLYSRAFIRTAWDPFFAPWHPEPTCNDGLHFLHVAATQSQSLALPIDPFDQNVIVEVAVFGLDGFVGLDEAARVFAEHRLPLAFVTVEVHLEYFHGEFLLRYLGDFFQIFQTASLFEPHDALPDGYDVGGCFGYLGS